VIILAGTHVPLPTKTSYQHSGVHACNKTTTDQNSDNGVLAETTALRFAVLRTLLFCII